LIYACKTLTLGFHSPEAGPDAWRYKFLGAYPGCENLRFDAWRYVLYQFCHTGCMHIFNNVVLQLLIGSSLEDWHGSSRIALIYNSGVVAGAWACGFTDVYRTILGASGGIFALFGLHFAHLLFNVTDSKRTDRVLRLAILSALMWYDVLTSLFFKLETTSYAAHAGGWLWGFACGIIVLRNVKFARYERPMKFSAALYCVLFVLFSVVWICLKSPSANWSAEKTYGAQSDALCCWQVLPYKGTQREWCTCVQECRFTAA
jgi:rhomboid-related protein 1/2/3